MLGIVAGGKAQCVANNSQMNVFTGPTKISGGGTSGGVGRAYSASPRAPCAVPVGDTSKLPGAISGSKAYSARPVTAAKYGNAVMPKYTPQHL